MASAVITDALVPFLNLFERMLIVLFTNALFYPFKDNGWFGKAIRVAFSYLLLAAPPFGYMFRVAQQVSDGHEDSLPETHAISDFPRGFQILLALIVYSIPAILISRILQPPPPPTAYSFISFNIDLGGIAKQWVINLIISSPFILAMVVGFIRFIITDRYIEFFNLVKNWDYFSKNAPLILSSYFQAYLATIVLVIVGQLFAFTICGLVITLITSGWITFVWGYTIGVIARKLNLAWEAGKSEVTFGFK